MRPVLPVLVALLAACSGAPATPESPPEPTGPTTDLSAKGVDRDLRVDVALDQAYGTPPQCYAVGKDAAGVEHNGCYTCHADARTPNYGSQPELQLSYALPDPATDNRWTNLFVDRSQAVAAVSDEEITAWVRQDNYHAEDGSIRLARVLAEVPEGWDADGDGAWSGYVPDAWLRFDDRGFDRSPDGTPTGWRTYAWHPRPGLFLPTNGAMTDALIRLPAVFRQDADGAVDLDVYALNLAVLEAMIKRQHVAIPETDEAALGVDLDKDGALGTATRVTYDWAPLEDRHMSWVGAARLDTASGELHPPTRGLFPVGTELFHTLRYLDLAEDGTVRMAPRMKEVRYLRKRTWSTYGQLEDRALGEAKEDYAYPDRVPPIVGDVERGVRLNNGWKVAGFIEDAHGELRPQTKPELAFCTGCHSGVSSTDDAVFSFGRKLASDDAKFRGWYSWQDHPMQLGDWTRGDGHGAYATYLRAARAGDPFRANDEVIARFMGPDGEPDDARLQALAEDATPFLLPSAERASQLNKVYRVLVSEQSFDRGRDPLPRLSEDQAHTEVGGDAPTGISTVVLAGWE